MSALIGMICPIECYVAVHLRGTLRQLPQEELLGILERLSGEFKRKLLLKPLWLVNKNDT